MKYLKRFNEAVIIPSDLKIGEIRSFDDAVRYGEENDFDVVNYDTFFNSLSERNKALAPPRRGGPPFFALFNPIRQKAMFVVCDAHVFNFLPMNQIIRDIIGHERIHAEQANRKGEIVYDLPSPTDRKAYFSDKDEIMAFSWSIANSLSKDFSDIESALKSLFENTGAVRTRSEHNNLWNDINKYCDEKVLKRYKKYIYLYLEKIFENKKSS